MTTKKPKRNSSGAQATKWFITTASVAAVLGGWVGFSLQSDNGTDTTTQVLVTNQGLEPIPTIVPHPSNQRETGVINSSPSRPPQTDLSNLRSVTEPSPSPITITRSSR